MSTQAGDHWPWQYNPYPYGPGPNGAWPTYGSSTVYMYGPPLTEERLREIIREELKRALVSE